MQKYVFNYKTDISNVNGFIKRKVAHEGDFSKSPVGRIVYMEALFPPM